MGHPGSDHGRNQHGSPCATEQGEDLLVLTDVVGICVGVGLVVAFTAGINERFAVDPPGPGRAVRATGRNWLVSTVTLGLPSAVLFLLAVHGLVATVTAFGEPVGP